MTAEQPKSPPGLPLTINFKIPADWTPEQALAVFELLDDLRDQIGARPAVRTQPPTTPARPHRSRQQQSRRSIALNTTIGRGPNGALPYPNDPSPRYVSFFTASNMSEATE